MHFFLIFIFRNEANFWILTSKNRKKFKRNLASDPLDILSPDFYWITMILGLSFSSQNKEKDLNLNPKLCD